MEASVLIGLRDLQSLLDASERALALEAEVKRLKSQVIALQSRYSEVLIKLSDLQREL